MCAVLASLMLIMTTIICIFPALYAIIVVLVCDIILLYFLISPLFGYAELRDECVLIKYGFILKREIPYTKIRGAYKERRLISDAALSLKCAIEHIAIRYNKADMTVVSVSDNEELLSALLSRMEEG